VTEIIDPKIIKEFFEYDHNTGDLFWKQRSDKWFNHKKYHYTWNKRFAGKRAGRKKKNGYKEVAIFDKLYQQHRVVWAFFNGEWPEDQIDHINGNPSDNRIENLRSVTCLQNLKNINKKKGDGEFVGVVNKNGRYVTRIHNNYKRIHIGSFDTAEEAYAAYRAKAAELFEEYANFGT
jgi:hypothetical protein